jgi:hypothetical protein
MSEQVCEPKERLEEFNAVSDAVVFMHTWLEAGIGRCTRGMAKPTFLRAKRAGEVT